MQCSHWLHWLLYSHNLYYVKLFQRVPARLTLNCKCWERISFDGARSRNRTGTPLLARDFKTIYVNL